MESESQWQKWLLALTLIMSSLSLSAQAPSLFDHVYGQDILKVELKTDIEAFLENRRNADYIPADFSFVDAYGQSYQLGTKIRVRGKYRRMRCDLPPIKLNFDKDELLALGFSDIDKFKLVTHCLDAVQGDDIVLREHLVYQLHQLVTPYSFRTQLMEITYWDTGTGDRSTHFAILIENEEEMARRLGGVVCDNCFGVNRKFDLENIMHTSVFQYMIGNADWSIANQKNIKVLDAEQSDQFQIVSYDFDFSGLVNAPYYAPRQDLGISQRERYYGGLACSEEQILNSLAYFNAKKEPILQTVKDHPFLSISSKRDIIRYLSTFFIQIDNGSGHKQMKGLNLIK